MSTAAAMAGGGEGLVAASMVTISSEPMSTGPVKAERISRTVPSTHSET